MEFEHLKLFMVVKWFHDSKRILFLSIVLCLRNEFQVYDLFVVFEKIHCQIKYADENSQSLDIGLIFQMFCPRLSLSQVAKDIQSLN